MTLWQALAHCDEIAERTLVPGHTSDSLCTTHWIVALQVVVIIPSLFLLAGFIAYLIYRGTCHER